MASNSSSSQKHKRKISADKLKHLADNLFWQAVDAYSFRHILSQYKKNSMDYKEEMQSSVAFYSIVYRSLSVSLVLLLARLFDKDGKSLTIRTLLNGMHEITEEDLHPDVHESYVFCNNKFRHLVKPVEECFFEKEVQEKKNICSILGYKYKETIVDLTLQDCVNLYQKRFRELKKKTALDNLSEQRNKIIAHNDSSTNFNFDSVFENFPLTNEDIEMLLDFAIDCTQFVKEVLTGVHTEPEYLNINDWEGSLQLIQIGLKYRDTHIQELIDEYAKENL